MGTVISIDTAEGNRRKSSLRFPDLLQELLLVVRVQLYLGLGYSYI